MIERANNAALFMRPSDTNGPSSWMEVVAVVSGVLGDAPDCFAAPHGRAHVQTLPLSMHPEHCDAVLAWPCCIALARLERGVFGGGEGRFLLYLVLLFPP